MTSQILDSLVYATQLSFVEEAPATHAILEKLSHIVRYLSRPESDSRFSEEWDTVTAYLEMERIKTPDRFTYRILGDPGSWSGFVPRCVLLQKLNRPRTESGEADVRIDLGHLPLVLITINGRNLRVAVGGSV